MTLPVFGAGLEFFISLSENVITDAKITRSINRSPRPPALIGSPRTTYPTSKASKVEKNLLRLIFRETRSMPTGAEMKKSNPPKPWIVPCSVAGAPGRFVVK